MATSLTKPCGRCGGSGHYSFNMLHGTMCYGCGGKGIVIDTQAAKKAGIKTKATAEIANCAVGDIITQSKIPYEVTRITWKKSGFYRGKNYNNHDAPWNLRNEVWMNQRIQVTCLVDGKKYSFYRNVFDDTTRQAVVVTDEMHDTDI